MTESFPLLAALLRKTPPWLAPGVDPVADLDALVQPFLELDGHPRTGGRPALDALLRHLPPVARAALGRADKWLDDRPKAERALWRGLAEILIARPYLEIGLLQLTLSVLTKAETERIQARVEAKEREGPITDRLLDVLKDVDECLGWDRALKDPAKRPAAIQALLFGLLGEMAFRMVGARRRLIRARRTQIGRALSAIRKDRKQRYRDWRGKDDSLSYALQVLHAHKRLRKGLPPDVLARARDVKRIEREVFHQHEQALIAKREALDRADVARPGRGNPHRQPPFDVRRSLRDLGVARRHVAATLQVVGLEPDAWAPPDRLSRSVSLTTQP